MVTKVILYYFDNVFWWPHAFVQEYLGLLIDTTPASDYDEPNERSLYSLPSNPDQVGHT